MVILPVFKEFSCKNYGLFPGSPEGTGITWRFSDGVTLIAGINGLGKTTLLSMLLRILTGPYDLSSSGLPQQIDSTLPESPTRLRPDALRFFGQRVADNAKNASATLEAKFGKKTVCITRNLQNLSLINFSIDKSEIIGDDIEQLFQQSMCELMDLSSFVDVLLVLHHMIFFPERRPGALWDENAQRHLMRAIFLPKTEAAQVAELERRVGSADSNARNLQAVLSQQEKKLSEAEELHAGAPETQATLKSNQALLDADLNRKQKLEETRDGFDEQRWAARLDFERAKIELEDAERAVERIKFTVLGRMFPSMPDTARLTILNLLGKGQCLVCGSDATEAKKHLEHLLSENCCPICSNPQAKVAKLVTSREVEAKRLKAAQKNVSQASAEEAAQQERLVMISQKYDLTLRELKLVSDRIDDLQIKIRGLKAELPTPSHELKSLREHIDRLRKDVSEAKGRRGRAALSLRRILESVNNTVIKKTQLLTSKFSDYCKELLEEEAALNRIEAQSGIAQAGEQFKVPLFRADLTSASRPGLTRRNTANDVSESQRELMDLAFRFSLTAVSNAGKDATFVMETPEASLDGVAMERVGRALNAFASSNGNRLIATSNLTNAGMIAYLFGGATKSKKQINVRRSRTIDLIVLAAKNRALQLDVGGRYAKLLTSALAG